MGRLTRRGPHRHRGAGAAPGRAWLTAVPVTDDRFVSQSQRRFIMEPHREEQPKALPPGAEQRRKRFRIIKLEERIAPSGGGGTKNCNNHDTKASCVSACGCSAGHCY
jgi:hypothetical protein